MQIHTYGSALNIIYINILVHDAGYEIASH